MAEFDDLIELIEIGRKAMSSVPESEWQRFENAIRRGMGATRIYIAARRKKQHLQDIADLSGQFDDSQIALRLNITPRRLRQLKQLNGK